MPEIPFSARLSRRGYHPFTSANNDFKSGAYLSTR
jgi:hypothetical protein